VVPDDKLSLAIGRRGQNVRLASRLTNWRLDVISDSKFDEREKYAIESLAMIDGIDEGLAKSMYKLGFRTIEEVAEAEPTELAGIPGLGNQEALVRIQSSAEAAMEEQRLDRIRSLSQKGTPITDRDKMLLVKGLGERTIELLAEAGYKTLESLVVEEDVDRLALNTGLGIRKAKQIMAGIKQFKINEEKVFEELRAKAQLEKEIEEDLVREGSAPSDDDTDFESDVEDEADEVSDDEDNGDEDTDEEDTENPEA